MTLRYGTAAFAVVVVSAFALLNPANALRTERPESSRRAFLIRSVATVSVVPPAVAYERRDVGDDSRSAATAAMNEQAYATNNRLEKAGFKLDSREEESARLSSALSSFSYDSKASAPKSAYNKTKKPVVTTTDKDTTAGK